MGVNQPGNFAILYESAIGRRIATRKTLDRALWIGDFEFPCEFGRSFNSVGSDLAARVELE